MKQYGTNFGGLDWLLILLFLGALMFISAGPSSSLFGGAIFWLVVAPIAFAWRRGWIQRYMDAQKAKEQAEQVAIRQEHAKRQATKTTTPTSDTPQDDRWDEVTWMPAYSISVPASTEWKPANALGLMRAVFERVNRGQVQFSIVATAERIEWQVMHFPHPGQTPLKRAQLENAVQTYYPDAQVEASQIKLFTEPLFRRYRIFGINTVRYFDRALSVNQIRAKSDPLETVVNTMGNLRAGELLRFDVTVVGVNVPTEEEMNRVLLQSMRDAGWEYRRGARHYKDATDMMITEAFTGLAAVFNNNRLKNQMTLRYSEGDTERYLQKLTQPLATTVISMQFDTPDKTRLAVLDDAAGAVLGLSGDEISISQQKSFTADAIHLQDFHDAVSKTPLDYIQHLIPERDDVVDLTAQYTFNLTAEELAALWHPPHMTYENERISWVQSIPTALLDVEEPSLTVGQISVSGAKRAVQIRLADLANHLFVSGMTGTGKSTLYHNLAHQLIQLKRGFTVLDPHGQLVDGLLKTSILEDAKERIVLLELANDEYPVPMNLFRRFPDIPRDEAISHVLYTLQKLYRDQWSHTQMETAFRAFLELIFSDPDATPIDVQEIADNPAYRNRLLNKALAETDRKKRLSRGTRNWWRNFLENKSDSERRKITQPLLNRLNIFLGKAHIEQMTCHPGAIDFRKIIEDDMIVLVNLSGQNIRTEVGSLGAIFFAQLYNAAQSLGYREGEHEPKHYMLIDETHRFMTNMADDAFSEIRKFGVSLIMADQWIGRLDKQTAAAIENNKGNTLTFRVKKEEADRTVALFRPTLETDSIVKFGVGEAAVATQAKGDTVPAFQMKTQDKPQAFERILGEVEIREQSRKNLARLIQYNDPTFAGQVLNADEIDDWIDARYTQETFDKEVKPKERVVTEVDLKTRTPRKKAAETTTTEVDEK